MEPDDLCEVKPEAFPTNVSIKKEPLEYRIGVNVKDNVVEQRSHNQTWSHQDQAMPSSRCQNSGEFYSTQKCEYLPYKKINLIFMC